MLPCSFLNLESYPGTISWTLTFNMWMKWIVLGLWAPARSVLGGLQLAWAEVWHPLLGRWWHHDKIYMHLISSTKLLPTWLIQMKAGNTTHQRAASWQIQSDYIITLLLLAPFKTLLCFFPFIQAFTKLLKECVIMYKVAVLQSFHKKFPETLNDADPSHSLVSRCEPTSIKKMTFSCSLLHST